GTGVGGRGGWEGGWVRCRKGRAKLAVPGGAAPDLGRDAGLGGAVQEATEWPDRPRRRRPADRRPFPKAEQWLMEHGLWVPLGIAIMTLFALVGLIGYVAGFSGLLPFSAFMFLIGLCSFLYGRFELKRLVGVKDDEDRPGET